MIFDTRKEVIRGVVGLTRHKEFFGHIVQQFQKVFVRGQGDVLTAATGRVPGDKFIKLYLNEDFFDAVCGNAGRGNEMFHDLGGGRTHAEFVRDVISGRIEHEVLHIALGHLFLSFSDKVRGNVAADCSANQFLDETQLMPFSILPSRYGLEDGKSALWYYKHLKDSRKYQDDVARARFAEDGEFADVVMSHKMWKDLADDSIAKEFCRDIVRKSKEMSDAGYGNLPGQLTCHIDDFLTMRKAVLPWNRLLRMFVGSVAEGTLDYTMKRESSRFGTRPGTRKGDSLRLAVAIDTSASISDDQLRSFWNEVRWIHRNGAQVWVYDVDIEVHGPQLFKGRWDGTVHGRGGTRYDMVLDKVEKARFDGLVYFTDFEAPSVERHCRVPVLWALTTRHPPERWPCQWGKRVYVDLHG